MLWGTLLVFLGVLLLVDNLNIVSIDWELLFPFWPVILIVWGLSKILSSRIVNIIVFIIMITGAIYGSPFSFLKFDTVRNVFQGATSLLNQQQSTIFTIPEFTNSDNARIIINTTNAQFTVGEDSADLMEVKVNVTGGLYEIESQKESTPSVRVEHITKNPILPIPNPFQASPVHDLNIQLTQKRSWIVAITAPNSTGTLDFSKHTLEKTNINGENISLVMKVNKVQEGSEISLRMKNGKLKLEIPEDSGLRIRFSNEDLVMNIENMVPADDATIFVSENFAQAKEIVNLVIEEEMTELKIRRLDD